MDIEPSEQSLSHGISACSLLLGLRDRRKYRGLRDGMETVKDWLKRARPLQTCALQLDLDDNEFLLGMRLGELTYAR